MSAAGLQRVRLLPGAPSSLPRLTGSGSVREGRLTPPMGGVVIASVSEVRARICRAADLSLAGPEAITVQCAGGGAMAKPGGVTRLDRRAIVRVVYAETR